MLRRWLESVPSPGGPSNLSQTNQGGGFGLEVTLHVELGGVDQVTAEKLISAAHQIWVYSSATRGNIPVTLVTTVG